MPWAVAIAVPHIRLKRLLDDIEELPGFGLFAPRIKKTSLVQMLGRATKIDFPIGELVGV